MKNLKTVLILAFIINTLCLYSQNTNDIMVNRTYYGKTLKNVLDDLSQTYGLTIDYVYEDVKGGIIPGKRYEGTLEEVLTLILKGKDLDFKTADNLVTIRKKGSEITLIPKEYL